MLFVCSSNKRSIERANPDYVYLSAVVSYIVVHVSPLVPCHFSNYRACQIQLWNASHAFAAIGGIVHVCFFVLSPFDSDKLCCQPKIRLDTNTTTCRTERMKLQRKMTTLRTIAAKKNFTMLMPKERQQNTFQLHLTLQLRKRALNLRLRNFRWTKTLRNAFSKLKKDSGNLKLSWKTHERD